MTSTARAPAALLAVLTLVGACMVYGACSDDSSAVKEPSPDAGGTSSSGTTSSGSTSGSSGNNPDGGDGGPTDCVQNPTTHLEIINACTNATQITKNPTLNKLLSDGGLPPLQ
jgi:hypothetical protein